MKRNRFALLVLLLASFMVLGGALLSQYVGGLHPCELCLYERWPYDIAIVLTSLGLLGGATRFGGVVLILSTLIFAASSGLAAYHVGVEQHWIAGPSACTGGLTPASSIEALQQALEARQPVQCDVVQWSFHGISLAGFNLMVSLVLTGFSFWTWRHSDRKARS